MGREEEQWKSYREKEKRRSGVRAGRDGKERGVSEDIRAKDLVTSTETNLGTPSTHHFLH